MRATACKSWCETENSFGDNQCDANSRSIGLKNISLIEIEKWIERKRRKFLFWDFWTAIKIHFFISFKYFFLIVTIR